jgi:hypothetical protein
MKRERAAEALSLEPPVITTETALIAGYLMAGSTGLEPATSGLTVQCANQAAPRARTADD